MVFILADFAPIYFHNFQLRSYVETLTQTPATRDVPDDALRMQVMEKAHQLDLPSVTADDVHVNRSANGIRIEVRYRVPVDFPGYTVTLHFYPGAGSR